MRLRGPLLWLLLLLLVGCSALAARGESKRDAKKRFIPFAREIDEGVKQGAIIKVPTRCPPNMLKMRAAPICLWLLLCCWLGACEAGLLLDKANEFGKDAQRGAKKVGDGIRGIFQRDERVVTSTAVAAAAAATAGQGVDVTTTPQPRTVIGSVKRCAPSEVFAAGVCRPTD